MIRTLTGKIALVTGAARGIGRDIALAFAEQDVAKLILLDRDQDALDALLTELAQQDTTAICCPADLRDRAALRTVLYRVLEAAGRVDVLVNNAGIADENEPDEEAAWHRVIDINLHGTFAVTAACLPYLADDARIVNMSSILGRAGKVRNTAYCASKHGVIGYTKALALDLAPRGITVNAVLPGWTDTPMLQRELAAQAGQLGVEVGQVLRNARKSIPMKRLIAAHEVADLVVFLVSQQAAAITAQSFTIDGGYTCGM